MERALYAAGMRDGDVVTLVDGLPATQETLASLGQKAHAHCVSVVVFAGGRSGFCVFCLDVGRLVCF